MTLFINPKIGFIRVSSRWTKTKKLSEGHTKIIYFSIPRFGSYSI